MPRTLFGRLLAYSVLLLALVVGAAGYTLDRFLVQRETGRLEAHLAGQALLTAAELPDLRTDLQEAIRRGGAASGVRLTVIARDGVVLADSEHDPTTMENHANRPEIRTALGGVQGSSARMSPTLGLEMLYVAIPGDPVVRAAMPLSDVRALLWALRRRVALAALPGVALSLAAALLLARGLTRRFSAMTGFATRLAAGDYETKLAVRGDDELADLERSLGELREELGSQVGALRRDRRRLQVLVDGLPDAVVLLDGAGRLTVANEPAQRLLRLAKGSIEGLPGRELLREPRLLDALDQFPEGGVGTGTPLRVSWPQPRCELDALLQPLPDEEGRPGILVVLRDVTRQAHLERVRTDFIANLSHELRTPLTAVRASAETLLNGALGDPEAARRFLESIRRNSLRLEALLGDVSDLARIEDGANAVQPRELDARGPARNVLELFRAEAETAGVALAGELPEEAVPVFSDADRVEQILVNLVQNAVRYTPRGGRVGVAVDTGGDGVRYRVADTGVGIAPADLPRVTERFYRVDPGRSRAQGGTGLGLSIVKHLVELLRGELKIESEHGRGTTVTVTLPNLRPTENSVAGRHS